jgi:hypothetical protein
MNNTEISCSQDVLERLSWLPKVPGSMGWYKQHDIRLFREDQIDAVREFGFHVE